MADDKAENSVPNPNRRRILGIFGAAIGGAALASITGKDKSSLSVEPASTAPTSEVKEPEKPSFASEIRKIAYEHLNNPESAEFQEFVLKSAQKYIEVSGITGVTPEDIVNMTKFHKTYEDFLKSIKNPTSATAYQGMFGATYSQESANMNLDLIKTRAALYTNYPGLTVYKWLVHEWGDLETEKRTAGSFLHNPSQVLMDSNNANPEAWDHYSGFQVFTKNNRALSLFDNAVNDFAARRIVVESLERDPDLIADSAAIFSDTVYFEPSNRITRLIQKTGMNTKQLTALHQSSDLEGLLGILGGLFKDSVLSEVVGLRGKTPEQINQEKNFLIGNRIAVLVESRDWNSLERIYKHLAD